MTSVNGSPTVVFSDGADDYETIYTSLWNGAGFDPLTVYYHSPGATYSAMNALKDDYTCVVFQATDSCNSGKNGVFFSEECGVCTEVSEITVTNISPDSVALSWNRPIADRFQVQYRKAGIPPITRTPTAQSVVIGGLQPGTQYQFRIRALCTIIQDTSLFTSGSFTTLPLRLAGGQSGLHLFPNPTKDFIFVSYEISSGDPAELKVFDMYGKMVLNRSLSDLKGAMRLPIGGLPSGHYLLQLGNSQERVMEKLVVVK
jgi:hypothetical protein